MKKVLIAAVAALFAFAVQAAAPEKAQMSPQECAKHMEGKNDAERNAFIDQHQECKK